MYHHHMSIVKLYLLQVLLKIIAPVTKKDLPHTLAYQYHYLNDQFKFSRIVLPIFIFD